MRTDLTRQNLPWHSRLDLLGVTFLIFLIGSLSALPAIHGSGRDLDYLENFSRFATQFFPPDWSILDRTLSALLETCLLYTSPSPRDATLSRMPSSA